MKYGSLHIQNNYYVNIMHILSFLYDSEYIENISSGFIFKKCLLGTTRIVISVPGSNLQLHYSVVQQKITHTRLNWLQRKEDTNLDGLSSLLARTPGEKVEKLSKYILQSWYWFNTNKLHICWEQ